MARNILSERDLITPRKLIEDFSIRGTLDIKYKEHNEPGRLYKISLMTSTSKKYTSVTFNGIKLCTAEIDNNADTIWVTVYYSNHNYILHLYTSKGGSIADLYPEDQIDNVVDSLEGLFGKYTMCLRNVLTDACWFTNIDLDKTDGPGEALMAISLGEYKDR